MTGAFRVPGYGRLDPSDTVRFSFDGVGMTGLRGDTVASALLAHGQHLMGRSFKYHRPRGPVAAGSEEPNALIGTSRGPGRFEPNTRATMQDLRAGLRATSQNRWPNLRFDFGAVNDAAFPLLAAGFYYKTFMWPKGFWDRVYEPFIRAAAGLGTAPSKDDPDSYSSRFHHCDVLVVGAGPAGLAAARAAAGQGLRVTLVDEHAEPGGTLLSEPRAEIDGAPAWDWLSATLADLRKAGVTILSRTTAIGYYHQNFVALAERLTDHLDTPPEGLPRERMWKVRAGHVVLAQGALEKPLVFGGNDRPGVMLAGAAQTYLNRFGVLVGRRPAVIASHDSAWHAAFDLADAGATVQVIADLRPDVDAGLLDAASTRGIPVRLGHTATATRGRLRVAGLRVNRLREGRAGIGVWFGCDCVLMSGGWTPAISLFSHTKGALAWDESLQTYLPGATPEACTVAGAGRGLWGIAAALEDGARAGAAAVGALGHSAQAAPFEVTQDRAGTGIALPELPTDRNPALSRAFVDFQNDVTAKDLRLAVREGMRSIEHVKRYTTNGMATDQGKLSNINGLAIASDALGRAAPQVGLTTFRPPYVPTTFGTFAGHHRGDHFEVTRRTPIDPWAEMHGAVFEPVGQWRRARYFPQGAETMDEAVSREARMTRAGVGLFDASTLGKIEVVGPDAVEFMNRTYTNPWTKLGVGRCRYGVLCGDDGYIRDDGVIGRLAEDRFHVTTTTGGAARVLAMMEDYLQTEWPELDVWLTSTTEHWATVAVNGPKAATLLTPLVGGVTLSDDAFPHMSCAECTVAGLRARLFRLSFTGEVGFEINVPAEHGLALWERLVEAGRAYDAVVYGTETMHLLRAEKGYIIVGQDTDGTVTPHDAGLSWAVGKAKPDFIGKRGMMRPDLTAPGRRQLVGLLSDDRSVLEEGAQIVLDPKRTVPMTMVGHVTSAYASDAVGRPIALALLEGGQDRMGETVFIPMPDRTIAATVVPTAFLDPDGARLKIPEGATP